MKYKPDKEGIEQFIDELQTKSWLGSRKWWPKYLFHFTDIDNAVKIISDGYLQSRATLESKKGMPHDNASKEIISQTDERYKNKVRLYFRPKTPTQYRNEGFRAKQDLKLNANCPVPVYFMFSSKELLTLDGTQFSDGSLARHSNVNVGNDLDFLINIPFKEIYHNTPLIDNKDEIINRRQAEVMINEPLELDSLKYIVCRSEAEKETLLYLLGSTPDNLVIKVSNSFFNNRWTFIRKVNLKSNEFILYFNKDTESKGLFHLEIKLLDCLSNEILPSYIENSFDVSKNPMGLGWGNDLTNYNIEVYLDNHIAFAGSYSE